MTHNIYIYIYIYIYIIIYIYIYIYIININKLIYITNDTVTIKEEFLVSDEDLRDLLNFPRKMANSETVPDLAVGQQQGNIELPLAWSGETTYSSTRTSYKKVSKTHVSNLIHNIWHSV